MTPPTRLGDVASALIGVGRIARGRADGLAQFQATPAGFLGALTPLLGFGLAGMLLSLARGDGVGAIADFASEIVLLLLPLVISERVAARMGCGDRWLLFATALTWSQWVIPAAIVASAFLAVIAFGFGLSPETGAALMLVVVAAYGAWLEWFIARHALALSRGRAVGLIVLTNGGTIVAYVGLTLLARALAD